MFLSAFIVALIVVTHLFAGKIAGLNPLSRRKWLSLAGGISVAFVFLHIIPELSDMQKSLTEKLLPPFFENDLFVIAMCGILLFYGVERGIIHYREEYSTKKSAEEQTVFWSHVGIFALFNIIIGYYLHNKFRVEDISSFLTVLAVCFHLLIVDYSLLIHHNKLYEKKGRWLMIIAVISGWAFGIVFTIPDYISSILFALLSGAIVINSFKEELPKEKESNYVFFLIGTFVYTLLLIL